MENTGPKNVGKFCYLFSCLYCNIMIWSLLHRTDNALIKILQNSIKSLISAWTSSFCCSFSQFELSKQYFVSYCVRSVMEKTKANVFKTIICFIIFICFLYVHEIPLLSYQSDSKDEYTAWLIRKNAMKTQIQRTCEKYGDMLAFEPQKYSLLLDKKQGLSVCLQSKVELNYFYKLS